MEAPETPIREDNKIQSWAIIAVLVGGGSLGADFATGSKYADAKTVEAISEDVSRLKIESEVLNPKRDKSMTDLQEAVNEGFNRLNLKIDDLEASIRATQRRVRDAEDRAEWEREYEQRRAPREAPAYGEPDGLDDQLGRRRYD